MSGPATGGAPGSAPADLVQAYLDSDYVVATAAGPVVLRIGADAPLPAPRPGRVHAVLSAGNPGSQARSAEANHRAEAMLRARLDQLGLAWRPAHGAGRDGAWPAESSVWIGDIALDRLDGLARQYGQNACVVVDGDGRARLRLYRPDWRDRWHRHADLSWP